MADPITIEVEGLRALGRDLKKIDAELPGSLKDVARDAAVLVATTARTLVPHRSGRLEGSIRTGATLRSGTVKAGSRRVPYASVVHFGWARRSIAPQPFIYRALDRRRDEVVEQYQRQVAELLATIHTGTGE